MWRRQSLACLLLNLNVLLMYFLYFIITEEISSTYKDRWKHHFSLVVLWAGWTWGGTNPEPRKGNKILNEPGLSNPGHGDTGYPQPCAPYLCFCLSLKCPYKAVEEIPQGLSKESFLSAASVFPVVRGKFCPCCPITLWGFCILCFGRSQSGGNLSQSCTTSLAKDYNAFSLCSLSNSISTTSSFAWNKSQQEKLRHLFTKVLMIQGKMFFILILSIKTEILLSKKWIHNDITCWQENLSATLPTLHWQWDWHICWCFGQNICHPSYLHNVNVCKQWFWFVSNKQVYNLGSAISTEDYVKERNKKLIILSNKTTVTGR